MRRAARVDANHAEIVSALRKCGFQVLDLSRVGGGCPDLLVCRAGKIRLVEVKAPKGRMTPEQLAFVALWPVCVVRSVSDVVILDELA